MQKQRFSENSWHLEKGRLHPSGRLWDCKSLWWTECVQASCNDLSYYKFKNSKIFRFVCFNESFVLVNFLCQWLQNYISMPKTTSIRHHSIKMGNFLIVRPLYIWLTLIGLHVEVAASRGRRGWGYGGRQGGWGAIAKSRAMDHAALGGGHSVAVAKGWATIAACGKAVGCWGNSRLHLTRLLLLLHVGMTRAWWHTRTVRAASPRSHEVPWYINHEPTFSSPLQEAGLNGWSD